MLYPFSVSIEEYVRSISKREQAVRCRPEKCPQCLSAAMRPHGFYRRSVSDVEWSGEIQVRRYWCGACRRTVSLLPDFVLPYWRFTILVMRLFLIARLVNRKTLKTAREEAKQAAMPYQRGQQWVRRFQRQAESIASAMAALVRPVEAVDFVSRAIGMLDQAGWIASHRFVFEQLRMHLLGWPEFLAPAGKPAQSG